MASDFLPYFKVYAAETLADEHFDSWPQEARGTWFTLLLHAWVNGSIPADPKLLARIARLNPRTFRKVWEVIGDRFVESPEDRSRLVSTRLERERNAARTKSESAANAAGTRWEKVRKSAESRKPTDADALRSRMPAETEPGQNRSVPPYPPQEGKGFDPAEELRRELEKRLRPDLFSRWFGSLVFRVAGDELLLEAPDEFQRAFVADNYREDVQALLSRLNHPHHVRVVLAARRAAGGA